MVNAAYMRVQCVKTACMCSASTLPACAVRERCLPACAVREHRLLA